MASPPGRVKAGAVAALARSFPSPSASFAGAGRSVGVPGRCSVRLGSPTPPQTPGGTESTPDKDARRFCLDALPATPCLASPLTTPGGRARATRGGGSAWTDLAALGSRLDHHELLFERQQAQIAGLQEEAAVLRDCLVRAGAVSAETFLIRLHHHRFAAAMRSHPLGQDSATCLAQLLDARELARDIACSIGPPGVEALKLASRSERQAMANVSVDLRGIFSESIVVVGGFDGREETRTAERFDPAVGAWELLPPMRERRSMPSTAVLAGCLHVCGGYDGSQFLAAAERFDPAASCWESLAPLAAGRCCTSATAVSGQFYICGGNDGTQELSVTERFDPTVGTWEALPPMIVRREGASAVALNNVLYVYGGTYLSSAERFDPSEGAWELIAPMSVERGHCAAVAVGGKLYACGGSNGRHRHSSAERYDPCSAAWEQLPPLAEARESAAIAVSSGKIYLCGGCDGAKFLSTAEKFDPSTCTWQTLRPMSAQRAMAATAVLDGMLYVCGGHDGAEYRRSVERFDPEQGTWELLPPMRDRRSNASACAIWTIATRPECCSHGFDHSAAPAATMEEPIPSPALPLRRGDNSPAARLMLMSPPSILGTPPT